MFNSGTLWGDTFLFLLHVLRRLAGGWDEWLQRRLLLLRPLPYYICGVRRPGRPPDSEEERREGWRSTGDESTGGLGRRKSQVRTLLHKEIFTWMSLRSQFDGLTSLWTRQQLDDVTQFDLWCSFKSPSPDRFLFTFFITASCAGVTAAFFRYFLIGNQRNTPVCFWVFSVYHVNIRCFFCFWVSFNLQP